MERGWPTVGSVQGQQQCKAPPPTAPPPEAPTAGRNPRTHQQVLPLGVAGQLLLEEGAQVGAQPCHECGAGLRGGGRTRGCRPSSPSSNSSACNSSAASLLWSSSSSGSLHWHVREGAAQQVKSRAAERRRSERCWRWPQVVQQCDLTKYPSSAASIQGVLPSSPPHRASAIWARRREPRGTVAVKASMQETCRCVKQSARDRPRPFFHNKWAADLARPHGRLASSRQPSAASDIVPFSIASLAPLAAQPAALDAPAPRSPSA